MLDDVLWVEEPNENSGRFNESCRIEMKCEDIAK